MIEHGYAVDFWRSIRPDRFLNRRTLEIINSIDDPEKCNDRLDMETKVKQLLFFGGPLDTEFERASVRVEAAIYYYRYRGDYQEAERLLREALRWCAGKLYLCASVNLLLGLVLCEQHKDDAVEVLGVSKRASEMVSDCHREIGGHMREKFRSLAQKIDREAWDNLTGEPPQIGIPQDLPPQPVPG